MPLSQNSSPSPFPAPDYPFVDPLIDAAVQATGLPWLLIYGVIEQESSFDPSSVSSCGALGLMQLMPSSFPNFTRAQLLDPALNVRLGSEFLRELCAMYKKETSDESIKFGLASYNGGPGYITRAQDAAAAAGKDPSQWNQVQPFLSTVTVNGKRPDVEQITDYVHRIWARFAARRAQVAA